MFFYSHLNDFYDMTDFAIKKNSINLSFYITYYLRLPNKSLRDELILIIKEELQK